MRKIKHRESHENCDPPPSPWPGKPSQPQSKRQKSYGDAQIEIQKSFEEKDVVSDQQRPQSRCFGVRLRLANKKPCRSRQREDAQAEVNPPCRLDGKQPRKHGERRVHPQIGIRAPIGTVELPE